MPICIAGMHRSGTSMVARLLNLAGVHLGPEGEMVSRKHDNKAGFWENIKFVLLNDEALGAIGASWDLPPSLEKTALLGSPNFPLREKAAALLKSFEGHEPWGWKDPRNSLTLPFWKPLIPDLKIVITIRNPIDVFRSLVNRAGSSFLFAMTLWLIYNSYALESAPAETRIITHYDSYFHDPLSELRRVAAFCGLAADDGQLEAAGKSILTELRHSSTPTSRMLEFGLPPEINNLYVAMCQEAGPVYADLEESGA